MPAASKAPAPTFVTPIWPGETVIRCFGSGAAFKWHRGETLGLAIARCTLCHGLGLNGGRLNETQPCNCVLRVIFRAVMQHYHLKRNLSEAQIGRCTLARFGTGNTGHRKWSWGFPDNEFLADVEILAKRVLKPLEAQLFRLHELEGLDWRACCPILKIDKGTFFHSVYRMEQKMGRAAREMRPYPLYPIATYYGAQLASDAIPTATATGDLRTASQRMRRAA